MCEARVMVFGGWVCECKTQTGTRVTGLRGYKEGRWECVQGECASRVRGLSRHGISRPQRYPTRSIRQSPADPVSSAARCQRRQRRPPGVASVSVSSMGALRHGGRWESGHVRVGIGMRCIPACATTPASQGPRHGSVPGEDQTGSTLSWCRSHTRVAALGPARTGAASTHRR